MTDSEQTWAAVTRGPQHVFAKRDPETISDPVSKSPAGSSVPGPGSKSSRSYKRLGQDFRSLLFLALGTHALDPLGFNSSLTTLQRSDQTSVKALTHHCLLHLPPPLNLSGITQVAVLAFFA